MYRVLWRVVVATRADSGCRKEKAKREEKKKKRRKEKRRKERKKSGGGGGGCRVIRGAKGLFVFRLPHFGLLTSFLTVQ